MFPVRILLLEDDKTDAELVREVLEADDVICEITRVQTRAEFLAALDSRNIDVILSDYTLPSFDGFSALKIALDARPELPFIFVSGTLGEEIAIDALKIGATDYVLKTRLARLVPAVRRALREARDRAERRSAEEALRRTQMEQKRAEDAARRSERDLRDVIHTMPIMAFATWPDGTSDWVNRRWVEYSGLSVEHTSGSGWQIAVHPDDLDEHVAKWRCSVATGEPFENEARHRSAQGEYRWFLVRAVPLRDEHGNVLKWYGTLTDIEDRKQVEEALKRSEAYLAESQGLSRTGSWAFNVTAQTALYWSEENFRIWCFDPQHGLPTRETILQRIHPEDRDSVMQALLDRQRETKGLEFRIVLPDGSTRHIEAILHRKVDPSGDVVEVIGTHIDVTERKRAEKERERLRQLEADLAHINRVSILGELTAALAHEIRQPIAATRINADSALLFLDGSPPALEEVRAALGCVVSDMDRAGNIIGRIRDHVKKAPPRNDSFDLNGAINEVIALARTELSKHCVSIQTRLTEGLSPLHGDRVQLQQVVLNLILNAVDAMSSAGDGPRELAISSERSEPHGVLVAVRDSGPGIDPEQLERVFEAFYTTKSNGIGMGLSICRSIIDAHGGRLWAEPNEPRGAVFQFTLPIGRES
jgi:PAS domain S-box-containing protein